MKVFFLGLGGNTGDRSGMLLKAVEQLAHNCGTIIAASSVYETESWGRVSENKFLNQVIVIESSLEPLQLLKQALRIETELGRKRSGDRFSDRTIDIDILFMGQEILSLPDLEIPHPLAHLRKFVLEPMAEISPDFVHPVLKLSMKDLLAKCPDPLSVKPFSDSPMPGDTR